jgi:hypothetical protein
MRNCKSLIVSSSLVFLSNLCLAGQAPAPKHVRPIDENSKAEVSEARLVTGEAKATAMNIKNNFQRGEVLDLIGAAEAKAGDLDAAVETARQAYPHTMTILTEIGKQLANSNDSVRAQLMGAALTGGGSSSVFAFMAQSQAKKGNFSEAMRMAGKIEAPEVRSDTLKSIAQAQADNGDYADARKTCALARSAYAADRFSAEDIEAIVAEGQINKGDLQAARKTISSISSDEMRSDELIAGAGMFLDKGDKENAAIWLQDALQALPSGAKSVFIRYMAIPLQVKLGQKDQSVKAADSFPGDLRPKGLTAVAVTCAEIKDVDCVNAALEKMRSAKNSGGENRGFSDFDVKLMILNVAAALLDNGEFEAASQLLDSIDGQLDEVSKMAIEPKAQLERVFAMAHQGKFDEARTLALKVRPDMVVQIERGTALRTVALLQTKKTGAASARSWAEALVGAEDRTYALVGIAQALLDIGKVELPYSAIQIH